MPSKSQKKKRNKKIILELKKAGIKFNGWCHRNHRTRKTIINRIKLKSMKKCKSGGAYRSDTGYIIEVCKFCLNDMPYGEKDGVTQQLDDIRLCMGKCNNACDYVEPYGFVPETGCKIHDN